MATTTPKAAEIVATFLFFGPDLGVFPASSESTTLSTRKLNRLKLEAGDETADFKAGQSIIAYERLIGANPRVVGSMNLEHPDLFLKKFKDEGPLVRLTVSVANQTLTGEAAEERFVFDGLMKGPEIDFLGNPGLVHFEIVAQGKPIVYFGSADDKP